MGVIMCTGPQFVAAFYTPKDILIVLCTAGSTAVISMVKCVAVSGRAVHICVFSYLSCFQLLHSHKHYTGINAVLSAGVCHFCDQYPHPRNQQNTFYDVYSICDYLCQACVWIVYDNADICGNWSLTILRVVLMSRKTLYFICDFMSYCSSPNSS